MAKFYTPGKISENIRTTPEGYLLCLGVPIARTGWQEYGEGETPLECGPDGVINIYRSSEEVFRPQTIASFQGKSITIKHPDDFVEPQNWQDLTHGVAQNVRKSPEKDDDGEECLIADLLITERMAIGLVKAGLRELSCGYEAEYEQTGEGEGKQLNIIGNHIALVEEGRAGSSYAIMDHKGKVNMDKKTIDKLKAKFGAKAVDEAMAEEKKEDKAKDAPTVSNESYDELKKMVSDLGEKLEKGLKEIGPSGKKVEQADEDKEKKEEKPEAKDEEEKKEDKKEEKAKDDEEEKKEDKAKDDDEVEADMSERVKALEAAVAKLLEKYGAKDEEKEDMEDDDFEESSMTGDSKKEKTGLEKTKNPTGFEVKDGVATHEVMTPEKMNELNAALWDSRK